MSFIYPDTEEKALYTELWTVLTTLRPSAIVLEEDYGTT